MRFCPSLDHDLMDEPPEAQDDADYQADKGEVGGHARVAVKLHAGIEAKECHDHEHQAVTAYTAGKASDLSSFSFLVRFMAFPSPCAAKTNPPFPLAF